MQSPETVPVKAIVMSSVPSHGSVPVASEGRTPKDETELVDPARVPSMLIETTSATRSINIQWGLSLIHI